MSVNNNAQELTNAIAQTSNQFAREILEKIFEHVKANAQYNQELFQDFRSFIFEYQQFDYNRQAELKDLYYNLFNN